MRRLVITRLFILLLTTDTAYTQLREQRHEPQLGTWRTLSHACCGRAERKKENNDLRDEALQELLSNPRRKAAMLRRIGLDECEPGKQPEGWDHHTHHGKSTRQAATTLSLVGYLRVTAGATTCPCHLFWCSMACHV